MKNNFFNDDILRSISNLENPPNKLIECCNIINTNYLKKHYSTVVVFSRIIIDYIPPVFAKKYTYEIYTDNFFDQKTFKKALSIIDQSTRTMADDILHSQASINEIKKVDKESCDSIRNNMILIIEGVVKRIKENDSRTSFVNRPAKIEKKSESQLDLFEKYLKNKKFWKKEFINNDEVWIYNKDNLYQIHQVNDHEDFSEPWTQVWADTKGSGKHSVDLRYNGTTIKQFKLIYLDGGRESIIMPKMDTKSKSNYWENKDIYGAPYKNVTFYILKNSIEYLLSDLIGSDIKRVTDRSHIEIR